MSIGVPAIPQIIFSPTEPTVGDGGIVLWYNTLTQKLMALASVKGADLTLGGGWTQLTVPGTAVIPDPSVAAVVGDWGDRLSLYTFNAGTEMAVCFGVTLPHGYKTGTPITPHIHFLADKSSGGDTTVNWQLDYVLTNQALDTSMPSKQNVSANITVNTTNVDVHYVGVLPELAQIEVAGPDAGLICRLSRQGGSDTYAFPVYLISIDFDIYSDRLGAADPTR